MICDEFKRTQKNVEMELWIFLGREAEVAPVPTSSIPCPSWTQGLSGDGV